MIDFLGLLNRIRTGRLALTRQPVEKFEGDDVDMDSWQGIQDVADKAVRAWTNVFEQHWSQVAGGFDLNAAAARITLGDSQGVADLIPWAQVAPQTHKTLAAVVGVTTKGGAKVTGAKFNLKFDQLNPKALEFIDRYSFGLITGVDDKSRAAIKGVIRQAFVAGGHPRQQAKLIQQHIGLTPRLSGALTKRNADLMKAAMKKAGVKTPGELKQKVQDQIDRQTERYRKSLLQYRARTIARTETIRAAAMGQQEAWRESAKQGLIDPANTVRVWITTRDDKTCPYCQALNGMAVALEGEWTSKVGDVQYTALTPPLHPNCRCAMGLKFGQAPLKVTVEGKPAKAPKREPKVKPVKPPKPPKAEPLDPWADKVKDLISKGVTTEKEAIKVGKLIATEIDRLEDAALQDLLGPVRAELDAVRADMSRYQQRYQNSFDKYGVRIPDIPRETTDYLLDRMTVKRQRANSLVNQIEARSREFTGMTNPNKDVRLQVMRRIRDMGFAPSDDHPLITGTADADAAAGHLRDAFPYIPRKWLEASSNYGQIIVQNVSRGFYRDGRPAVLALSGSSDAGKVSTALHEMMHRAEEVQPLIRRIEWEFYERRTKGYTLRKFGKGYADWEVYRKDNFLHNYMGKDYRPSRNMPDDLGYRANWELLSMGIEHEFFGAPSWAQDLIMRNDPEYRHFVLGILAGL